MAEADTIVFDKTGTLTKAKPTVAEVVSFNEKREDELLRIAACLEEHFPHSMAKAVVDAAKENIWITRNAFKVEYIVAHGISQHRSKEKKLLSEVIILYLKMRKYNSGRYGRNLSICRRNIHIFIWQLKENLQQ